MPMNLRQLEIFGAVIADRAVFFSRTAAHLDGPVSIRLPETGGEWGCLVTGLSAGRWNVEGPASFGLEVTEEGRSLYFRGPAGQYILTRSPD